MKATFPSFVSLKEMTDGGKEERGAKIPTRSAAIKMEHSPPNEVRGHLQYENNRNVSHV